MHSPTPTAPAQAHNGKAAQPGSALVKTVQPDNGIDSLIDDRTTEQSAPTFPLAQWLNGNSKLSKVGGVAYPGGLIIPFPTKRGKRIVENIPTDFVLPGFTAETVEFDNGTQQAVLAAPAAELALIRFRRCVTKLADGGKRVYMPWSLYWKAYEADPTLFKGWRGKYQVLVAFKSAPQMPFALTLTGTNSQAFETGLPQVDEFAAQVGKALGATKRLSRLGVWATLTAGAHVIPNPEYTSKTTPPVFTLPTDATAQAAFVGRENLKAFTALWHAAQGWVDAYANNPAAAENGNGHAPAQAPAEEEVF